MAIRPSLSIFKWGHTHKAQLAFISSVSIVRFGTSVAYVMLTVVISQLYDGWVSGLMIGVFNIYQALITDPIAGGIADKIGGKTVVAVGSVLVGLSGLLWLLVPLDNLYLLTLFALLLFTGYSFRDEVYTYLLRTSNKNEGGSIFGAAENAFAITTFLATLSLPFFIAGEQYSLAAIIMIITAVVSFLIIITLPSDKKSRTASKIVFYNPFSVIKRGWHFVKTNQYFPLLMLANSTFEGIFYGTLWLVIPLKIVTDEGGILAGLTLGVYELVTIFAAAYFGYLADRYNWVKINAIGWTLVGVGSVALLFSTSVLWLVIIGAVVAIGNNLFAFAASHALEENDIDHKEDGAFIGLNNLVVDLGYGISPLLMGFVYSSFGFTTSLSLAVGVSVVLAVTTIPLAQKLKNNSALRQ